MERYINAYGSNVYDKPTSVTYLRIPGTLEYIQETLDIRLSEGDDGAVDGAGGAGQHG